MSFANIDNPRSFAPPSDPFAVLTNKISTAIFRIRRNLTTTVRSKDPERISQLLEDTREIVRNAQGNVKELSTWDTDDDRRKRFEKEKIQKEFTNVLVEFQQLQKNESKRQRQDLRAAKEHLATDREDLSLAQEQSLVQQQESQNLDPDIAYNELLINQREDEIRDIEEGITELNEIFRDLGTMIGEQGVMVDNIEANVSSVATNTKNASAQLTIAAKYQRKARKRACVLLMVFLVIFAIVLLAALT
ncbi:Syntaxin pep12 [Neolecta irregularis DAH-3]|uniref:Syntaxin pep12 n=1 Tax=Neolecta irregularis (strain DAH-3) TaxID=1198029 RepID=A0A1U7LPF8_NEOID|nr:Syntaxin pep12 [Neolecta irregularis DAH-3]|eukprot:OLL24537.1 Syntaxin pep12 [Neolecta irregularis DAH-3]